MANCEFLGKAEKPLNLATSTDIPIKYSRNMLFIAKITCCDEKHEIGISRRGRIAFFNHSVREIRRSVSLHLLGGELTPCASFFYVISSGDYWCKWWEQWESNKLESYFNNLFNAMTCVRNCRKIRRIHFVLESRRKDVLRGKEK
jgi:hypothetical protein